MTSSNLASSKESAKPEAELLPFHPSADVFDLMDGQEFEELAADIERRGLRIPIITYKGQIIDGRNRARACAKAGVPARYEEFTGTDEEVERFIISMNIHRRHLKAEERRAKLKQLLGMHPEKSDRVIAAETGYSHTAVQKARQSTGNKLPVGGKRKGKDGIERRMPKRRGAPAISKDLDAPTMAAVRKKLLERTKRGENPSIAEVTAEVLAELKSAGTGEKPCSDCGGTGTCPDCGGTGCSTCNTNTEQLPAPAAPATSDNGEQQLVVVDDDKARKIGEALTRGLRGLPPDTTPETLTAIAKELAELPAADQLAFLTTCDFLKKIADALDGSVPSQTVSDNGERLRELERLNGDLQRDLDALQAKFDAKPDAPADANGKPDLEAQIDQVLGIIQRVDQVLRSRKPERHLSIGAHGSIELMTYDSKSSVVKIAHPEECDLFALAAELGVLEPAKPKQQSKKGNGKAAPKTATESTPNAEVPLLDFDCIPCHGPNGTMSWEAPTKTGAHTFRVTDIRGEGVWKAMLMPDQEELGSDFSNRESADAPAISITARTRTFRWHKISRRAGSHDNTTTSRHDDRTQEAVSHLHQGRAPALHRTVLVRPATVRHRVHAG